MKHNHSTTFFDSHASTPTDERVIEAMIETLKSNYANPHSNHFQGWQANSLIESAKCSVAELIGGFEENIIFTSGATEANNQVIASVLRSCKNKRTILISAIEHKSVSETVHHYADKLGHEVLQIPVDTNGFIIIEEYEKLLKTNPLLVSIIAVNNEIGVVQDIGKLSVLAQRAGSLFHTDAVQAVQVVDIPSLLDSVDFLTISAHKLYGPKGIGALYYSPSVRGIIQPLILGGSQQNGMRAGTCPTHLCVGFGKAAEIMIHEGTQIQQKLKSLSQHFMSCLHKYNIDYRLNGSVEKRHPGNINIELIGVDAEALLSSAQPNICASTGSACNSGNIEPSAVLSAIGLDHQRASSSIRFGLNRCTTEEEIENAIELIAQKISEQQ